MSPRRASSHPADGGVVRIGDTTLLSTVAPAGLAEGIDFFR
jgi:hypothetical protein